MSPAKRSFSDYNIANSNVSKTCWRSYKGLALRFLDANPLSHLILILRVRKCRRILFSLFPKGSCRSTEGLTVHRLLEGKTVRHWGFLGNPSFTLLHLPRSTPKSLECDIHILYYIIRYTMYICYVFAKSMLWSTRWQHVWHRRPGNAAECYATLPAESSAAAKCCHGCGPIVCRVESQGQRRHHC